MTDTPDGQTKTHLDDGIAGVLRRWAHHTGPIRESRSLYHKGTVLAVTAESGERYVLKEVAKGQPLERRLERLAAEHRTTERVCLVSSDFAVRGTSGQEVRKISSGTFVADLAPVESKSEQPHRLAERVDQETRDRLERLRRNRSG